MKIIIRLNVPDSISGEQIKKFIMQRLSGIELKDIEIQNEHTKH